MSFNDLKVVAHRLTHWHSSGASSIRSCSVAEQSELKMENENNILTALNIERFRGLQDVQISPLKRVNLIMGQNNTGKTGILEALFLLSPHGDAYHAANLFRNLGEHLKNRPDEAWNWLMPNGD